MKIAYLAHSTDITIIKEKIKFFSGVESLNCATGLIVMKNFHFSQCIKVNPVQQ